MDQTNFNQNQKSSKDNLFGSVSLFLLVATAFLVVLLIKELKPNKSEAMPSIAVSGSGEVFAVPDVAMITFTIKEEAKTSKEATDKMTAKETKALEFLKEKGIEEKDIKTLWLNTSPKYEYAKPMTVCTPEWCPPSTQNQQIVGYETNQTIQVKVRDTEKAGEIISGITAIGIGEVSGPEFSVDDVDALRVEARKLAIEDAKEKAKVLGKDLDVKLVRIISYSEGGDYPMYYAMGGDMSVRNEAKADTPQAPALSTGEQKITSSVTIVYEIK
ncbi:MAG TPA: SIMPL domain-containing protein [Candidatus Paceibacterota bacterium]|nr:SIMPL domain-containing protein [Candidatus Paceibacterota bacterium]